MKIRRLCVRAGILCLVLGLCAPLAHAQDKGKLESYKEKLKEIENSYRKILNEAMHESSEAEKKAGEIVKKLQLDLAKLGSKEKEKRAMLKAEMDHAKEELAKIQVFRKHYEFQLAGFRATLGWDRLEDRLGAVVKAPAQTLIEQLGLAKGEGMVVDFVPTRTFAAKMGLKPHDVMLKVGGMKVPSDTAGYKKLCHEMKTDRSTEITVLRGGKLVVLSAGSSSSAAPEIKKKEAEKKKE